MQRPKILLDGVDGFGIVDGVVAGDIGEVVRGQGENLVHDVLHCLALGALQQLFGFLRHLLVEPDQLLLVLLRHVGDALVAVGPTERGDILVHIVQGLQQGVLLVVVQLGLQSAVQALEAVGIGIWHMLCSFLMISAFAFRPFGAEKRQEFFLAV